MLRARRRPFVVAAVLALMAPAAAHPAAAQQHLQSVFPGSEWERVERDNLEAYGWSPAALRDTYEFIRDSANTTGLVVADRGRIVFTYGDVEELSYLASVRKSILSMLYGYWVENGTIDLEATMADL
ncbi:MAG: hypothetical protein OEZ37_12650, partial [Gemmatimonadota bacterium]|nr:hypothetical protein [Gemmatimonadota bacterium]